jgi:multiple sugar transport system substrate-binding protein
MHLKTLGFGIFLTLIGIAQAQKTEVVWWDFLSGGDGVRMKAMIDVFNESHPDIRINATTLEWGTPYYTKVQTAVATGQAPDVMTYHVSRFPLAVPSGILRPFSDEELASVDLSRDDYFPNVLEKATIDGNLYGVPFDISTIVLYFNKGCAGSGRFAGR